MRPLSKTGLATTPEITSRLLGEFERDGLVDLVGGCRGTTPEHIEAIAQSVEGASPRPLHESPPSPNGSSLHLIGELMKRQAGIDMRYVPYKGTTQALQDLIGGQVQVMSGALPTLTAPIKAGQVRALAVTTAKRADAAPELPTLAEGGVKNIDVPSWYGVMAPAATPPTVVARAQAALADALAVPAVKSNRLAQGLVPVASKPADFGAQIKHETAVWAVIIKAANIKAD